MLLLAWLCSLAGVGVRHPVDGTWIGAVDLLNREGLRKIITGAVRNFTGFAPLGFVLVAMMGVGVAERGGLLGVVLRGTVLVVPRRWLTPAIVLAGILAHVASDAGIVILPPLAAMLFAAVGRHPLAGMAAAFAGVSGGYAANLLPTTLDVLLVGFTQAAVDGSGLLGGYKVQIVGNYLFLLASAPLVIAAATWVTHRIVEPRLGPWTGGEVGVEGLKAEEKRGLRWAAVALVAMVGVVLLLTVPAGGVLRGDGATLLAQLAPFFDGMIMVIVALFFVPGLAYGLAAGTIRGEKDVAEMIGASLSTMGTYIALAFVAAQFVAWFSWSNLGPIIAIGGADALRGIGLTGGGLLVAFVGFAIALDLLMPSASAKWAVLAPIFVPMFLLLGYSPEATQVVYRIGDSVANVVTPLNPYMPFLLGVAQKYRSDAGIGTLMALMLPFSLCFTAMWLIQLLVFYGLDWSIGPGVGFRRAP